jgi:hypothetical protein
MEKLEALRLALAELGDAPASELAAFVRTRYGVEMPQGIIPVIKATLRDKEQLERARAARGATTEAETVSLPLPPEQPALDASPCPVR